MPDKQSQDVDPLTQNQEDSDAQDLEEYVADETEPSSDDESQELETSHTEEEIKKFQALHDQKDAELKKASKQLDELAPLGELLEARPDIREQLLKELSGEAGKEQEVSLEENEFDPWAAFYDPNSASYKMRKQGEEENAREIVKQELGQFQEQIAINNLRGELQNKYGMSDSGTIDEFIEFATAPKEQLGLDVLVDVFKSHKGLNKSAETQTSQQPKADPKPKRVTSAGGIAQGAEPQLQEKDEEDQIWDAVVQAGGGSGLP